MLRLKLYLKAAMLRTASSKLITLRNSGKASELRRLKLAGHRAAGLGQGRGI